jgi:predicted aspartyl protease
MQHRTATFLLTCLTVAAAGPAQNVHTEAAPSVDIPFELNHQFGSILVRVRVNGEPAVLLVDTGSSHTILSGTFLGLNPCS